jgi:hypothetical protein
LALAVLARAALTRAANTLNYRLEAVASEVLEQSVEHGRALKLKINREANLSL